MMNCKRPLEIEQVNISNDLQTLSNKKQRMHSESNVSKVNGKDQTSSTCIGNLIIDNVTRLREMTDSTLLYQTGQYDKLKLILDTDGYLLIRKVIPEPTALKARNKILFHLKQKNAINIEHDDYMKGMIAIDKRTGKLHEGWTIDAESGGVVEDHEPAQSAIGWSEIGNCNEVTAVYNGESLAAFYQNILGEHTTFPSCTWLRAKGHGEVTAEHVDYYYFRQNTQIFSEHMENKIEHNSNCQLCYLHANDHDSNQTVNCALCTRIYHTSCLKPKPKKMAHNLKQEGEWHCDECAELAFPYWTCWISMGNVTSEDGRLAVQPGSHTQLTGYNCPSRVGLTPESYTPKHEKKQKWFTSTFGPGDIVLFNVKLIHAATKNTSTKFRISCDSRVTKHQQDNSC